MKVPGFDYGDAQDDPNAIAGYGVRTPERLATPTLTKSPLMGKSNATRGWAAYDGSETTDFPPATSARVSIDLEMAQTKRKMSTLV